MTKYNNPKTGVTANTKKEALGQTPKVEAPKVEANVEKPKVTKPKVKAPKKD